MLRRYAIRITEDTLPLIMKLNDGRPIQAELSHYIMFSDAGLETEFNTVEMSESTFYRYFPTADRDALLQLVK
jgi:hypothetical protein